MICLAHVMFSATHPTFFTVVALNKFCASRVQLSFTNNALYHERLICATVKIFPHDQFLFLAIILGCLLKRTQIKIRLCFEFYTSYVYTK